MPYRALPAGWAVRGGVRGDLDGGRNALDGNRSVLLGAERGGSRSAAFASSWWTDASAPIGPRQTAACFVRWFTMHGVGTFFGDDEHDRKPVRVRYVWSEITSRSAGWEQALSADGGATWETNWTMRFERLDG